MITVKCPDCGKKIIWDDFQPMTIKCPDCGREFSVKGALRENIKKREGGIQAKIFRCPHCNATLSRRWFIKCSECGYWVFGNFSMNSKLLFIGVVILGYIFISWYFFHLIH